MAAPTLVRRELKNARVYFTPVGEVVDSVTVASATWPDAVPTTNYTGYQFPEIETVSEEVEVETETRKLPRSGGGYQNDTEEMVISRMWKAGTARTNSYVKQLQHGLATVPAAGTAQVPGAKLDNFISGIFTLEVQNKNGVIIERVQVWAKMRLASRTAGDIKAETALVELSFEMQESANNTIVVNAG